jgi:RHS repeat-associated protein
MVSTGRENDGTGVYFYRARYYSATFQRFIAQDPIGFAGTVRAGAVRVRRRISAT